MSHQASTNTYEEVFQDPKKEETKETIPSKPAPIIIAQTQQTIDNLQLLPNVVAQMSYPGRLRIHYIFLNHESLIDKQIKVCGWSKTIREGGNKAFAFVSLNDGSCKMDLQVIIDKEMPQFNTIIKNGVDGCFQFVGTLVKSIGSKQPIELQVKDPQKHSTKIFGSCQSGSYELGGKKFHSPEFLRTIAHLRPRTRLISSVARIRNALAYATHQYFQQKGFLYIHTPLITCSDCEGAGEMFQVTTLHQKKKVKESGSLPMHESKQENKEKIIDYSKDFFGKPAYLTVSGQLNVETYSCAMGDVYTFGPTFRAENSHTSRHLAEFWMIEPQISFADIFDLMKLAEGYIKYCLKYVLQYHREDLQFFNEKIEKGLIERLENVVKNEFKVLTYTQAIEILQEQAKKKGQTKLGLIQAQQEQPKEQEGDKSASVGNEQEGEKKQGYQKKKKKDKKKAKKLLFQHGVPIWGDDLHSQHERYLTETVFKRPVVVHAYPAAIKSFYMRMNENLPEDRKTVAAMDILLPKVGQLVGGSQREERLDVLDARIDALKLNKDDYWWYRALRQYGTVPHAGFGLGFERLVMTSTGVENIRDVIPFPRVPGHAEF